MVIDDDFFKTTANTHPRPPAPPRLLQRCRHQSRQFLPIKTSPHLSYLLIAPNFRQMLHLLRPRLITGNPARKNPCSDRFLNFKMSHFYIDLTHAITRRSCPSCHCLQLHPPPSASPAVPESTHCPPPLSPHAMLLPSDANVIFATATVHADDVDQNEKKRARIPIDNLSAAAPVARHTSHVTCHMSHVTRHTSHVTRHTSHVTHHDSSSACARSSILAAADTAAGLTCKKLWFGFEV